MTAIERLEAQIAGLTNLARDYEAEWKARRMAVHVLSNALSELRDADPAPDCERCDEAVNRDVGHIAEKLGCEATVEAVEAAVERLIARLDTDNAGPFDHLTYRFDIVLRGRRQSFFENRPEGA